MKSIYINGRFITQPITGVQRSALEILKSLDDLLTHNDSLKQRYIFICLVPHDVHKNEIPNWQNIDLQIVGKLTGNLWEQIELPFFAQKGLLLCLCNIGPVFHFNQLVVFHDASVFAVPEAYSFPFLMKYRFIMWVLARTSRKIITDSIFSKNELVKYLKINKEKISVIPLGSEHIFNSTPDYSIMNNKLLKKNTYLLTVGSSSPHKNVTSLVTAFYQLSNKEIYLVIAGGKYSKVFKEVEESETDRIIRLGFVTDGELRALYENALCFIFPSYYEGFGFPPLEAMSCGCPVISSNSASLPEACGDAALYFNPNNINELSQQISQVLENENLRKEYIAKGLKQVEHFTWEKTVQNLISIIDSCQ